MTRITDRCPMHPGEIFREDVIPATAKPGGSLGRRSVRLFSLGQQFTLTME